MSKTIELSESLYQRLQALAGHLFTVEEAVDRLVESASQKFGDEPRPPAQRPQPSIPRSIGRLDLGAVHMRAPRERGVTVEVAGQRIHANTVRDLYEQVFRLILGGEHAEALRALIPYATSNQRYLISKDPKHQNGNRFFVPVSVGPYYIEAHKNYDTALKQLDAVLSKLGLDLQYVGG